MFDTPFNECTQSILDYFADVLDESMTEVIVAEVDVNDMDVDSANDSTIAVELVDEPENVGTATKSTYRQRRKKHLSLWEGFSMLDGSKDSGGRMLVQCDFCFVLMRSRKSNLRSHKESCLIMPARLKLGPAKKKAGGRGSDHNGMREEGAGMTEIIRTFMSTDCLKEEEIHELLAKIIVKNDLSVAILDCELFQAFFRRAFPDVAHLTRDNLTHNILPKMEEEIVARNVETINSENGSWTAAIDGWKDAGGIGHYNIVLRSLDQDVLFCKLDIPECRGNAGIRDGSKGRLMDEFEARVTEKLNAKNIHGMVARPGMAPLRTSFENIIPMRCFCDTLNLMCKDVLNYRNLFTFTQEIVTLGTFFRCSAFWSAKLDKWAESNGQSALRVPTEDASAPATWYSLLRLCRAIGSLEEGFKYCYSTRLRLTNAEEFSDVVANILTKGDVFVTNRILVDVLEPVLDAIDFITMATANVAFVWETLYEINAHFETLKVNGTSNSELHNILLDVAQSSWNRRAMNYMDSIYVVAFFLSPKYRKIAVSRHFSLHQVKQSIEETAQKWDCYEELQLAEFKAQVDGYYEYQYPHHDRQHNALEYWQSLPETDPGVALLRDFALKVLSLVPHTASSGRLMARSRRRLQSSAVNQIRAHLRGVYGLYEDTEQEESAFKFEELIFDNKNFAQDHVRDCGFINSLFKYDSQVNLDTLPATTELKDPLKWAPDEILESN